DMDAPIFLTSVASSEESHDDTIDIGVDRVHPVTVVEVAFPVATVIATLDRHGGAIRGIYEHLQRVPVDEDVIALRFKVEIVESENTFLIGRIKTLEAINTLTRDQYSEYFPSGSRKSLLTKAIIKNLPGRFLGEK
ncbi:hypothetical protein Tco_0229322, partial [Tanacetum coccineum]